MIALGEVSIELDIDRSVEMKMTLLKYYKVMTAFTRDLRKSDICVLFYSIYEEIIMSNDRRLRHFEMTF